LSALSGALFEEKLEARTGPALGRQLKLHACQSFNNLLIAPAQRHKVTSLTLKRLTKLVQFLISLNPCAV